jgi:hypothetical protein
MYQPMHVLLIGSLWLGLSAVAFSPAVAQQPADHPALMYNGGEASDPGKVPLSLPRLFRLEPKLGPPAAPAAVPQQGANPAPAPAAMPEVRRARIVEVLTEHLDAGDSRAAVVVSTKPLLIAAYSDELDCVAMLEFPDWLVREHDLKPGSRLLTVNTYPPGKGDDLQPGPKQLKKYENFYPLIADFVTEDKERVRQRKAAIAEEEWERCSTLAKEYRKQFPAKSRDGSPLHSMIPAIAANPGLFLF